MPPSVIATAGTSILEVEEPDLVIYRMGVTVTAQELRELRAAEEQWNRGKRHLLVLVDSSKQREFPFETRKVSMEPSKGTLNRALALYGGNATLRVLSNMLLRALEVMMSGKVISRMFRDEASALQWLYEQRPRLVAREDTFDDVKPT